MNDPDNFLSRWSRRKQEAGEGKEKNETGEAVAAPAPENQQGKPAAPGAAPIPEFDVESLPPIEIDQCGNRHNGFHANRRSRDAEACGASSRVGVRPGHPGLCGAERELLGRSRA